MTAVKTMKENWYEAEINRVAGEIALQGTEPDTAKAEAYFASGDRDCSEAESEILGAPSRDEHGAALCTLGQAGRARGSGSSLGWFTQGFDTLDLRQAKLLLEELRDEASDRQMNAARSL